MYRLWLLSIRTVVISVSNRCYIELLRVSRFLHFLQLLCHTNAPNQLFMFSTHKTTQMTTKIFRIFCVFSIFFFRKYLSIFLKIMFKNNVCVNLTTKTSKYRVDVSQLSLQCFPSFLSILPSKKSKHIFFRKFFHVTLKNSYLGSKLQKNAAVKFLLILN
jgi:hypothetical protein